MALACGHTDRKRASEREIHIEIDRQRLTDRQLQGEVL